MEPYIQYRQKFEAHKICVLIPTFNNAATLGQVINDVLVFTSNIIVVNDGSTDGTSELLEQCTEIKKLNYSPNLGKGWALRQGFKLAIENGFDYAITIDSDGQHFAKDLPNFIDKLEQTGPALLIGARNMDQASVPGKSSFGNKFSNFWFWIETGIRMPDTQSGYRLYPLCRMKDIKYFTKKYEFEIEVIVKAAWRGIKVEPVSVSVYYAPKETRVSHFRPFKDFSRISVLNTVLVFLAFLYIKPKKIVVGVFKKSTYVNIKNEIFNSDDSRMVVATSVAFGVFMGIVPIWGFQLVVAIFLAILFRLNKAIVIISAHISIPPMIPIIVFLSYKMGAIWMGHDAVQLLFDKAITLETIRLNFIQYIYGSVSLAVLASLLAGACTYVLVGRFKKKTIKAV